MSQTISRPASWANAAHDVEEAAWELQNLKEEWLSLREEFIAKWTSQRVRYITALDKLASLQRYYSSWSVPFNLSDGKVQEKLDEVADINVQELRDGVPDLEKINDPLATFDAEDAW